MMRGQSLVRSVVSKAAFGTFPAWAAPTAFRFPAMSPTMTEGGIARWVVKEGDSFAPGDVLLEIETDKATMDVETTEEGVMGKIIMHDGAKEIQVGTLIAITAEEGDDISNLNPADFEDASASSSSSSAPPPAEEPKKDDTPSTPAPSSSSSSSASSSSSSSHPKTFSHSQPLSPSVNRLLLSSSLSQEAISALKGSGMRGALTKGDVLKAMGKTSTVWGSKEAEGLEKEGLKGVSARYKLPASSSSPSSAGGKPAAPAPAQDPVSVRRAIIAGFSVPPTSISSISAAPEPKLSFDSLIADYAVNQKAKKAPASTPAPAAAPKKAAKVDSGVYEGIW